VPEAADGGIAAPQSMVDERLQELDIGRLAAHRRGATDGLVGGLQSAKPERGAGKAKPTGGIPGS
jgi:hypothetical protein